MSWFPLPSAAGTCLLRPRRKEVALLLASGRLVHADRRSGFAALPDRSGDGAAPVHVVLKSVHAAPADPRAGHATPRLGSALNPWSDAARFEISLTLVNPSLRQ